MRTCNFQTNLITLTLSQCLTEKFLRTDRQISKFSNKTIIKVKYISIYRFSDHRGQNQKSQNDIFYCIVYLSRRVTAIV